MHRAPLQIAGLATGLALLDAALGVLFLGLPADRQRLAFGVVTTAVALAALLVAVFVASRGATPSRRPRWRLAVVAGLALTVVLVALGSGNVEAVGKRVALLAASIGTVAGAWWFRTASEPTARRGLERAARWAPLWGLAALAAALAWRADATAFLAAAVVVLALLGALAAIAPDHRAAAFVAGLVVAGLGLALLPAPSRGPAAHPPPAAARQAGPSTVVLVTVDTLRADHSPCRFAERRAELAAFCDAALEVRHARAPAPWTLPSLASFLTGLSPAVHGVDQAEASLSADALTLAAAFAEAGFHTAAFADNPFLPGSGLTAGFATARVFPVAGRRVSLVPRLLRQQEARWGRWPAQETDDAGLTRRALRWLEARPGASVFLWIHYYAPHAPYQPPADLLTGPGVGRVGDRFDQFANVRTGLFVPTAAERGRVAQLYRGEAEAVARELDRLLAGLRRLERADGATVAVVGDHGEELWEHGGFQHGHTLYDELLRVPFLVRGPHRAVAAAAAAAAGGESSPMDAALSLGARPIAAHSVAALLLDSAGLDGWPGLEPWPADRQRSATRPDSETPPGSAPEAEFLGACLYYGPCDGVLWRDGGTWKYTLGPGDAGELLFELEGDPGETTSRLAEFPERGHLARQALLEARRRSRETARRLGLEAPAERTLEPDLEERLRALGYLR